MRIKRPFLPGSAFHLTARTIGHEPWLAVLRDDIITIFADGFSRTDAQLLAFAIMSNHFHLIVRQGRAALSVLMHAICRGIALRAQRVHEREGHIFERRYRATPCLSPQHLRNAIVYTHRNPVKAGLCAHPRDYPWCSYWAYSGRPAPESVAKGGLSVVNQLHVFASTHAGTAGELCADYERYAEWCDACSRLRDDEPRPPEPGAPVGDDYWRHHFRTLDPIEAAHRCDLRDLVRAMLRVHADWLTLDQLRAARGGHTISCVRHAIIRQARLEGFPVVAIARYLNISETTVCKVTRPLRPRPPGPLDSDPAQSFMSISAKSQEGQPGPH